MSLVLVFNGELMNLLWFASLFKINKDKPLLLSLYSQSVFGIWY